MEKKFLFEQYCFLLLVLVLIFKLFGCSQAGAGTENKSARVRPVKAMQLENVLQQSIRTFPGKAKAVKEVSMSFRVGGPLVELNADTAGQEITKGDVIARIDPRDFEILVKTLEAKLAASKAHMDEVGLQYERYQNLLKENAAAKATFDRAKAAYEMATAQVDADSKSLESARNSLRDTVLTAPFTGFVHKVLVENHETVAQGQTVVSLVDLSQIEVEIGLPENLIPRASDFREITCKFEAFPGKTFKAKLKEIGKKPNPSNRTYPLTLILHHEKTALVRPGMAADVAVVISNNQDRQTFVIPSEALVNDDTGKTYVWILNPTKETVEKQMVKTGGFSTGGIELTGNLFSGQWVVIAGAHFLEGGQQVRLLGPGSKTNIGNQL